MDTTPAGTPVEDGPVRPPGRRPKRHPADTVTVAVEELDLAQPAGTGAPDSPPAPAHSADDTPAPTPGTASATQGRRGRGLTFRMRWALTVAGTFAAAGCLLVAGEYLLVTQLIPPSTGAVVQAAAEPVASPVSTQTASADDPAPDQDPYELSEPLATPHPVATPDTVAAPTQAPLASAPVTATVPPTAAPSPTDTSHMSTQEKAAQAWQAQQQAREQAEQQRAEASAELTEKANQQGLAPGSYRITTVAQRRTELRQALDQAAIERSIAQSQMQQAMADRGAALAEKRANDTQLSAWQSQIDIAQNKVAQWDEVQAQLQAELDGLASSKDKDFTVVVSDAYSGIATITSSGVDPISVTYNYSLVPTDSGDGSLAPVEIVAEPASTNTMDSQVANGLLDVQRSLISSQLSRSLIGWSVVLVVAFAALAGVLAWWLAGRGTRRIATVTALARDVSAQDLTRRLDLPGPRDEIKELGDTFDSMLGRIESAFEAQRRFVANASHELRTPLATTRAALEIPLAQGKVSARLRPSITTALDANARSQEIITSLLALASPQSGKGDLVPVPLDDVVREAVAMQEGAAVTWHEELSDAVAHVDAGWATQAVGNLISNAVLHNVPGGEVWVTTGIDGPDAYVQVSNTGAELDQETVDKLTEPFYRGEESRLAGADGQPTGIGLGLSIVEAIAEAADADLLLSPRDGGGLVARMIFPGLAADAPAETGVTPAHQPSAAHAPASGAQ